MATMTITLEPAELHAALDADWELGDDATAALEAAAELAEFPVPEPLKAAFWTWFQAHRENVVLRKRILFFTVSLRVKHLKFLFEKFFGPEQPADDAMEIAPALGPTSAKRPRGRGTVRPRS